MYSRRIKTEERRNIRKAILFLFMTLVIIVALALYGIPAATKLTSLVFDLKKSSEPVSGTDTTAPPPPKLDTTTQSTNNSNLQISGNTEAGATVEVFVNNSKDEILSDNSGRFSTEITLDKGENKIWATAKDSSGNESGKSAVITVVLDTDPPPLDITKPSNDSAFYGSKQRQIEIDGITEQNSKLQINNRLVVVDSEGKFVFITTLVEGQNTFNLKSEDSAGNKTEKSLSISFTP